MNAESDNRNLQGVFEIRFFDRTTVEGLPTYRVIIHFSQAARQLMCKRGQDVFLEARKLAKKLVFLPTEVRIEMRDTFADLDMLGPPTSYPDSPGTMAWLSES
ncbi:MAG TPA: hypothetical protein VE641_01365 [Chthoniobacterales bacterium]|nr:hypothetical protein [Chthoniobacterales bacterium]